MSGNCKSKLLWVAILPEWLYQKGKTSQSWWGCREMRSPIYCWLECKQVNCYRKRVWKFLNWNQYMTQQFQSAYRRDRIAPALLAVAEIRSQTKGSLSDEWIQKMGSVRTMEYHSATRRMKYCHLQQCGWTEESVSGKPCPGSLALHITTHMWKHELVSAAERTATSYSCAMWGTGDRGSQTRVTKLERWTVLDFHPTVGWLCSTTEYSLYVLCSDSVFMQSMEDTGVSGLLDNFQESVLSFHQGLPGLELSPSGLVASDLTHWATSHNFYIFYRELEKGSSKAPVQKQMFQEIHQ